MNQNSQSQNISMRVIIDVALVISVLWGWWYIALPLSLIALWMFPYYIEILIAGFAFDALFGLGRGWGLWGYAGTIVSGAAAGAAYVLKIIVRR